MWRWCSAISLPTFRSSTASAWPGILKDLVMLRRGLILMVGASGHGKSTTLAAMINHRNANASSHIITIEDPIEFLHPNRKSIINQREVGLDTRSYARALRSSMREAPDVILIGEIRDRETMQAAIDLAGTGHLAIATLHANNSPETLDRIINMYPNDQHKQVFMDLSQYVRAVISQRLVRGKKRQACCSRGGDVEYAPCGGTHLERRHQRRQRGVQGQQRARGFRTFDNALFELYRGGSIGMEEALSNADSRTNLEAKINFG